MTCMLTCMSISMTISAYGDMLAHALPGTVVSSCCTTVLRVGTWYNLLVWLACWNEFSLLVSIQGRCWIIHDCTDRLYNIYGEYPL